MTRARVVDAYTIQPGDIKSGDIMLFVVKAMVVRDGVYQLYRCPCPFKAGVVQMPQGSRINNEQEVCEALFPSLAMVAEPDV